MTGGVDGVSPSSSGFLSRLWLCGCDLSPGAEAKDSAGLQKCTPFSGAPCSWGWGGLSTLCLPSDTPNQTCIEGPLSPSCQPGTPPPCSCIGSLPSLALLPRAHPHRLPGPHPGAPQLPRLSLAGAISSLRLEPSSSSRLFLSLWAQCLLLLEPVACGCPINLVFSHLTLLKSQSHPNTFPFPLYP